MKTFTNYRFSNLRQSPQDLLDMPIAKQGWVKFFVFDDKTPLQQLQFFENNEYHENKKIFGFSTTDSDASTSSSDSDSSSSEEKDEFGAVNVPARDKFWIVLNKLGLFALSSRRNDLTKTVKAVHMNLIKPIVKTKKGLSGGLEDIGNFREGFCFKVISVAEESWIMCLDDVTTKNQWIDTIEKLKGSLTVVGSDEPQLEGEVTLDSNPFSGTDGGQYKQTGPEGEEIETTLQKSSRPPSDESEWVVLQDWSTCTLACGGGTQTLHRRCKLSKNPDAAPCVGEPILTRECNTQACPHNEDESSSEEDLPLKIKIMRVSLRPQRYETCIIKEGDMEIVRDDLKQFQRPPRLPVRVVLNNQTFTVFQNAEYENVLFSAPLNVIGIQAYAQDQSCLTVFDGRLGKGTTLCSLPTLTAITPVANRNEWVEEIAFFKDHCKKELPITNYDPTIADLKRAAAAEEEAEAKSQAAAKAPESPAALGQVANMAVDAMSKEAKYEQLAEQEELDREILEEIENRKRIEEMKHKEECLARDQRKAASVSRSGLMETNNVQDMKNCIKNMILNQRSQASKKIEMMKKMANRKKRAADDEVQALRVQMAKEAMAAQKLGDITKCDPRRSPEEKNLYCNREFDTDPNLNQDCKDPESYCFVCCENEAGVKHIPERTECFAKCQVKPKGGNWIWVPESNAVKA